MAIALVLIGLLLLAPAVFLAVLSLTSRRPDNLGVTDGKLAACPDTPNCVSSQAADAAHRVEPLRYTGAPGEAWARLVRTVSAMARTEIVKVDDAYLHAECTSALFRFVDDVEFALDADRAVIHCRSASRAGYSDLGVNHQRIEMIRATWETGE